MMINRTESANKSLLVDIPWVDVVLDTSDGTLTPLDVKNYPKHKRHIVLFLGAKEMPKIVSYYGAPL